MFKASDIALWFIYKTNAESRENIAENDEDEVYEGLTHVKLQQLLYYSQGVTLSITNRKLFKEKILASEHGPIIPEVYNLYKNYGKEILAIKANENNDKIIENMNLIPKYQTF